LSLTIRPDRTLSRRRKPKRICTKIWTIFRLGPASITTDYTNRRVNQGLQSLLFGASIPPRASNPILSRIFDAAGRLGSVRNSRSMKQPGRSHRASLDFAQTSHTTFLLLLNQSGRETGINVLPVDPGVRSTGYPKQCQVEWVIRNELT
jgi:hypothetical protein